MPHFRYQGFDAAGRPAEGTVESTDVRSAANELVAKGLRLTQITPAAPPAPSQAPIRPPASVAPGQAPIATSRPPQPIKTRRAGDKDRFLLFSQVADMLKAGISPHQAFGDLATRLRHDGLAKACRHIHQATAEGGSISSILEQYPRLFPPHVVGMIRAGETGGFLPEAASKVAEQAQSAHKFRMILWFVYAVILNALVMLPLAALIALSLARMWDTMVEESGATGGFNEAMGMVWQAFLDRLIWPIGPLTLLGYGIFLLIRHILAQDRFRLFRHRLGLAWPVLGPRARSENLAIFSWALSRISNSGVVPATAWKLGVDCVPNVEMQRRLERSGALMREGSRMSDSFHASRLFPDEYAPMMATAEMTGDIPGALNKLSEMSKSQFEVQTTQARLRTGCWSCLGCGITSFAAWVMIFYVWYYWIPNKIMKWSE